MDTQTVAETVQTDAIDVPQEKIISLAWNMVQGGHDSSTHHATLRRLFREETGEELDKEGLQQFRVLLDSIEAAEANAHAPDAWTMDDYREHYPEYTHVVRIVETSPKSGRATRVVIECESCGAEREIAVQDAFQVTRCKECQRKAINRRRRKSD